MSTGIANADTTKLQGTNPHWRAALMHDWGPSSFMIGTSAMVVDVYDDPLDTSYPTTSFYLWGAY